MSNSRAGSTTARTSYIVCPFFHSHGEKNIRCEGLIDGVLDTHVFDTVEKMRDQERIFCMARWKCCEYASGILKAKYPEEDDNP